MRQADQYPQKLAGRASVGVCFFFFPFDISSFVRAFSYPQVILCKIRYKELDKLRACDNVVNMRYF